MMCVIEQKDLPDAISAQLQLLAHLVVVLLNHQVGVGVVRRVEVCDDAARDAKNAHDCGAQSDDRDTRMNASDAL